MIPLKKCNFITGDINSVSFALTKVISFLEDDGRNSILFSRPKRSSSNDTSLKYLISNKIEFVGLQDLENLLFTPGNLFRVDLIIFDFWHLNLSALLEYKKIIDRLEIDHIIVAKEYHYKNTEEVTDYHITSEIKGRNRSHFWISDKISGWTSNLEDLSTSYIRDKKITQIINKSDN